MWVILWEQIEDRTPVHSFGIWCSVVLYNVLHGSTSPCHTARSHISSLLNPDSQLPTFSSQKDSPIGLLLTSVIRHQVEVLLWSSWLSVLACILRCLTVKFDGSAVAQAPINVSAILTRGCRLGRIIHSEESILGFFLKTHSFSLSLTRWVALGPCRGHGEGHEVVSIPGHKQKQYRQQETDKTLIPSQTNLSGKTQAELLFPSLNCPCPDSLLDMSVFWLKPWV